MFCPKCGNEIKEGTKFCPKCGNEFKNKQERNQQNSQPDYYSKIPMGINKKTIGFIVGVLLIAFGGIYMTMSVQGYMGLGAFGLAVGAIILFYTKE